MIALWYARRARRERRGINRRMRDLSVYQVRARKAPPLPPLRIWPDVPIKPAPWGDTIIRAGILAAVIVLLVMAACGMAT